MGSIDRNIETWADELTILAGATASGYMDLGNARDVGFIAPANWTTADGFLTVCNAATGTFVPLEDSAGTELNLKVEASKAMGMKADYASALRPWRFLKFNSGTSGSTVAQVGTLAAVVLTPDTGKTLTFTSGVGGTASNSITIAMTTAEDDVLAVTNVGPAISIALAMTTASNNSAAAIQAAIRSLTVSGITMTSFTVAGNAAYNAAPVVTATIGATALSGGDDTHIQVVCKA